MVVETGSLTVQARAGRPGQLHRDINVLGAREVFELAFHALEPADRTQRQAFSALMPELYMLRNKGFSFQQIATLMGQCGFKLQPSTVRNYFSEMLADRQDECVRRMNEQMMVLAEIKKATKGAEISMIAGKAVAILERQRSLAPSKVEAVFGMGSERRMPPSPASAAAPPPEKISALRAAPAAPAEAGADDDDDDDEDGLGFGLAVHVDLDAPSVKKVSNVGNAFFDGPADPVVPDLSADVVEIDTTNSGEQHGGLHCLPLQLGVKPLARRPEVPEEVYSDGLMEHPDIPGLMLSRDERVYGALLEIVEKGEVRTETVQEKVFRVKWKKPIPRTITATGADFVQMDGALFKNVGKGGGAGT